MNNEQLKQGKQLYDAINNVMSNSTIQLAFFKAFPNVDTATPEKIFLMDTLKFMLYIACADESLSQKELNIINYFTGIYLTKSDVDELLKDNNILSDLENEVPLTVKFLCLIENSLYKNNSSLDQSLISGLITYFKLIGYLIADSDNNVDEDENNKIQEYIEAIKEYANENTLSPFFECE